MRAANPRRLPSSNPTSKTARFCTVRGTGVSGISGMVMRAHTATKRLAPTTRATLRNVSEVRSCEPRACTADFAIDRSPQFNIIVPSWRLPLIGFSRRLVVGVVRLLQMLPEMHEQSDCHAHYDQSTDTEDQKPPDHPHSRLGQQKG